MCAEDTCNGYHRYGKENCTAHRIDESTLDKLIYNEDGILAALVYAAN